MPAGFNRCVKKGGRVRRVKPKRGVYINICYLGGKSYRGEVHHIKQKAGRRRRGRPRTEKERRRRHRRLHGSSKLPPRGSGFKRKVDKKMRSYGDIDLEKKTIRINPKKGELLNTIVHEELHRKYPNKSERWVKKRSKKEEKSLSLGDAVKLIKKYQRRQNG